MPNAAFTFDNWITMATNDTTNSLLREILEKQLSLDVQVQALSTQLTFLSAQSAASTERILSELRKITLHQSIITGEENL
jgi:hypothetical protein